MGVLRIATAVVVIAIWAAAYGKSLLVTGAPTPPAELSGLMLAVVTWLFAGAAKAAGSTTGAPSRSAELRRAVGRWLLRSDKGGGDGADAQEAEG